MYTQLISNAFIYLYSFNTYINNFFQVTYQLAFHPSAEQVPVCGPCNIQDIAIKCLGFSLLCCTLVYVGTAEKKVLYSACPILAIANTQFGQEMAMSCKPRMCSAGSIPIVLTSVCFLPLKMYTCLIKILDFNYKTDMF